MTADPVLVTLLAEHTLQRTELGWFCAGGSCDWVVRDLTDPHVSRKHREHLAAVVEGRVQERIADELEAAADEFKAKHERGDDDPWYWTDAEDILRDRAAAHRPEGGSDE
jgi:hypothetical protein